MGDARESGKFLFFAFCEVSLSGNYVYNIVG